MKKCPFCSEEIQDIAKKCRYCGEWIENKLDNTTKVVVPSNKNSANDGKFNFWKTLIYSTVIIAGFFFIIFGIMGELKDDAVATFFGTLISSALIGVLATFVIRGIKNTPKLTDEDISKYSGLEGWLTFVILGLIISLGYNLYYFYEIFRDSSDYGGINGLFAFDFIIGLIFLILTIYVIYLFFTKKKSFPKYYSILLISTLLFNIIILALMGVDAENSDFKNVFRSIFSSIIWVPYIMKSKRARATFIK